MTEFDDNYWTGVVLAIQNGDIERFREIVMEHQDSLRFTIAYHVRGDAERIDEILHCSFIEAYRSLHRFTPGKPLKPWLKQIARRQALKDVRASLRPLEKASTLHDQLIRMHEASDAPEEKIDRLDGCMKRLKQHAQQIVQMRYFKGMDSDSIGEALGIKPASVRVSITRILAILRGCMERTSP